MSMFRLLYHSFWSDEKVLEYYDVDEKLLLIFLLTNKNTTQIGIYKFHMLECCFYTGFSKEAVLMMLDKFENEYGVIKYNKDTGEICIVKWAKYNINRLGGKPAMDCLRSDLKKVEDKSLLKITLEYITKEEIRKLFIDAIGEGVEAKEKREDKYGHREAKKQDELLYEKPTEDQLRRASIL